MFDTRHPCYKCSKLTSLKKLTHCCRPEQIICQDCRISYRCLTCNQFYPSAYQCSQPCSCLIHSDGQSNKYTDQLYSKCISCGLMNSKCRCVKSNKKHTSQTQFCDKCTTKYQVEKLFCNLNCGHSFCRSCLSQKIDKCFCGKSLDEQSIKLFLKICYICDKQVSENNNESHTADYVICKQCKLSSQFLEESIVSSKKQAQNQGINRQETISRQKIKKNEDCQITKKQLQIDHKSQVELINTTLSQNSQKQMIESKYQTPQKLTISCDLQSSSKVSVCQPKQFLLCCVCNIKFSFSSLSKFPGCPKSHSLCKLCLAMIRRSKMLSCRQCEIQNDERIAKLLTYLQLKDEKEKDDYMVNFPKNCHICSKCNIIVKGGKLFGNSLMCILCVSK